MYVQYINKYLHYYKYLLGKVKKILQYKKYKFEIFLNYSIIIHEFIGNRKRIFYISIVTKYGLITFIII